MPIVRPLKIFQPNPLGPVKMRILPRQLRLAWFQRRVRGVHGLELQLHTGSGEVENPPDANRKSEDEQGDGEELLQRFSVTYKSFRNHESLAVKVIEFDCDVPRHLDVLLLIAFTVTAAAQVVGTLLVLSLAITPAVAKNE